MSRSLHLGFVCAHWHPRAGGVERHTRDLARSLVHLGHAVSVLCTADDVRPGEAREEWVEGVLVRRCAPGSDARDTESIVRRWLRESAPDVVHVHHLTGLGTQVLRTLRSADRPVALTLHDYWYLCPRGQMWNVDGHACSEPVPAVCADCQARTWPHQVFDEEGARERIRSSLADLASADLLIAPSASVVEVYRRAGLGVPIRVVPNSVEVDGLRARVQRLSAHVAPGARLGVLGAVQPTKGVLELARSVVAIDEESLTLDVYGSLDSYHGDATYVEALQALATREPRIRIHGPCAPDDVPAVLAALDALAVPSLWEEPFGLGAREALAAGLPVFVSDRGGLADLAREAPDRCIVLPARDRAAWSEALTAFARGAGPRRASGSEAGPRSTAALTADLLPLYRELP